jgi:Rieske Fe-S protein
MAEENDPCGAASGPGEGCTRRRLLANAALVSGAVATGGSVGYPLARFLLPPEEAESSVASMVAGKVSEFPVNSGRIVRMGSRPVLVLHLPGGEFRAFSAKCTHLSCLVKYRPDTKLIFCACHGGTFDLTGKNISGPPPRPLEAFTASVRGEKDKAEVVVSRAN